MGLNKGNIYLRAVAKTRYTVYFSGQNRVSYSIFKWNFLPNTSFWPEKYTVYLRVATQLAATPCLAARSPSFGQTSGHILRPGTGHSAT